MSGGTFGSGSGAVLLDIINCSGNETSLFDCEYRGSIGNTSCVHSQDAGVRCQRRVCKNNNIHLYGIVNNSVVWRVSCMCVNN